MVLGYSPLYIIPEAAVSPDKETTWHLCIYLLMANGCFSEMGVHSETAEGNYVNSRKLCSSPSPLSLWKYMEIGDSVKDLQYVNLPSP